MSAMESEYICDYCSRSFTRKYNLLTHIENCHLNSTCSCDICEARFGSPAGLQLHLSRGHNRYGQPSPECDICGRIFTRKQNITSHMATVHMHSQRPVIQCNLCSKIFTSTRNLKRHLHQLHNPNFAYLFCDECTKVFKGKHSLIAHIQTVHTPNRGVVKCHLCIKVYSNKRNLKRHMEISHNQGQDKEEFKCNSCDKVYTSNQSLKRHVRSSHAVGKLEYYTCKYCTKLIVGKQNYRRHTLLHHSQEKQSSFEYLADFTKESLKCETCNVGYNHETALRQHIKNDHGFQEFYAYCKKSLLLRSIEKHRDMHKKQNFYYNCEFCYETYNTVIDLKNHMRNNHDTEYILSSCNVCFKKFFSKETLAVHKETCIPPANAHECNHCDKLFTNISSLEFHIRVFHPQTLTTDSNIAFGNAKDDAGKAFKCTECDRKYHNDRSLKHHIKQKHTKGGGSVECEICGKICINKYYLESHLRLVHNDDYDNQFNLNQKMKSHRDTTVMELQKYKCEVCASSFTGTKSYRKHMREKHLGSIRFPQSPMCEKRFESENSSRTYETLVHSSNFANQCSYCNSSFETKEALDKHQSDNHSKDAMYKCNPYRLTLKEKDATNDKDINKTTFTLKYKSPRCILCLKDFSSRKTLKRHIKKFHSEFDVDELANFGTQRPEFNVDCPNCIKNFADNYHFSVYLKWKHLTTSIVFKCESCKASYNTLEYSIQRYKHNLDLSKKLYLSELCTTEMSDADNQKDFKSIGNILEADAVDVKSEICSVASSDTKNESTDDTSDIDIKSEPESNSDIKSEQNDDSASECDVKSEPHSP